MPNNFKRKLSRSIGTSLTQVGSYAVGSNTEVTVIGLDIANTSSSQVLVDATLNDGSNDTYLIKEAPIPSGGSLVVIGGDQKVVLANVHGVFVSSNTASSLDAVMSILEVT